MAMRADLIGNGKVSRRTFIAGIAGATVVMGIGVVLPGCSREEVAGDIVEDGASRSFAPTVWYEIDSDGVLTVPQLPAGVPIASCIRSR